MTNMEITSETVNSEFEDAAKCIDTSHCRRSLEAFTNLTRLMNRQVVEEGTGILHFIEEPPTTCPSYDSLLCQDRIAEV